MSGSKSAGEGISAAFKHPLRAAILERLNEGQMSPSQFVDRGLVPKEHFRNRKNALSTVSYHFRELERAGCLEVVDEVSRRGATEHVYRGLGQIGVADVSPAKMTLAARRRLSKVSCQGLIARVENAMRVGTLDSRPDRFLGWMPFAVDRRGWEEMTATIAACFEDIERIRDDARDRLAGSGEEVITVTVGMLGFESPPAPPLPLGE